LEIKAVDIKFAEKALLIYKKCAAYHAEKGFFQWDDSYPNSEVVKNDIKKGWLFGGFEKENLIALIAITDDEPIEYHELKWNSVSPYKIIHRLCVDTNYMRKGYANKMMSFAENYCRSINMHSIRLDTYTPNEGARNFYSKLNYIKTGEVNFKKRKENTYTCFEKVL